MKLFLSSENLGKYSDVFVKLAGKAKSVLYIGNAKDYLTDEERAAKVNEHRQQFEALGLKFTELDLRDYFDNKVRPNILDGYSIVWCSGGNTFLLQAALSHSGLDRILVDTITQGTIAYGGSSAGALVAGPTLKGAEYGDDPNAVKEIYDYDIEWSGLELVSVVCVPHCDSDWFGKSATQMITALASADVPYIALNDGQVYLVDGANARLLV